MKIFASKHVNRTIEIVVDMYDFQNVEADTLNFISDRDNLPADQRYTEEQLQWYDDLIENIVYAIEDYAGYTITQQYQSNLSYSYYIQFKATDSDGNSLGNFEIKIRIADHMEPRKKSGHKSGPTISNMKGRVAFRSIYVNEVSKKGIVDVMKTIWHILDELLAGNIEVLDELAR